MHDIPGHIYLLKLYQISCNIISFIVYDMHINFSLYLATIDLRIYSKYMNRKVLIKNELDFYRIVDFCHVLYPFNFLKFF